MPQSYSRSYHHVIFSTKNRASMIDPDFAQRLYDYIGGIIRSQDGQLIAAGGTADHIHLLFSLHLQTALADMLRDIKANASRWIHETFPSHRSFAWQTGYGAFSVSQPELDRVRQYISNQAEHHQRRTFEEEFVEFLKRHGLDYDPKHLWG